MTFTLQCPYCQRRLQVTAEFAGRPVGCPHCGQVFMVGAIGAAPGGGSPPPAPLEGLFGESLGGTQPLGSLPPIRPSVWRRSSWRVWRRMGPADVTCLVFGLAIALLALAGLFLMLPGLSRSGGASAVLVLALLGGTLAIVLVAYALRRAEILAGSAALVLVVLLFVGWYLLPPAPESSETAAGIAPAGAPRGLVRAPWAPPEKVKLLHNLGLAFLRYHDAKHDAPPSWEALESFAHGSPEDLAAVRQARSEGMVANWGVSPFKVIGVIGTWDFVLAYEKSALESGGPVLFLNGSVEAISAEDLRKKLEVQSPLLKGPAAVTPSVPKSPSEARQPPPRSSAPSSQGAAVPPAPEPVENRRRRQQVMTQVGANPDLVYVYVDGVDSDAVASQVGSQILEANWKFGILMRRETYGGPRRYTISCVPDIREFAIALDLGPITRFDEARGEVHLRLDPAKLQRPPRTWIDMPLPESVVVPPPPEPAESRAWREKARQGGLGGSTEISVVVEGVSAGAERDMVTILMSTTPERAVQYAPLKDGVFSYSLRGIADLRAYAAQLDLGTFRKFDEERGILIVRLDPAKFAARQAALSAAASQPTRPTGNSSSPPPPEKRRGRGLPGMPRPPL